MAPNNIIIIIIIDLLNLNFGFCVFFMAADGPLPSVLQEVSVPVINNTLCEGMYRNAGYIEHIPHIFICAGWKRGGYDSCEGEYHFLLFGFICQNQVFTFEFLTNFTFEIVFRRFWRTDGNTTRG